MDRVYNIYLYVTIPSNEVIAFGNSAFLQHSVSKTSVKRPRCTEPVKSVGSFIHK